MGEPCRPPQPSPRGLPGRAGAPGPVLRRRYLADLRGQRGDDLDPPALPRPDPQGQGGRVLALRVLALAGQGHRRHRQAEPGARADGRRSSRRRRSRASATGSPIPTRRGARSSRRRSARPSPWPGSWASRSSASSPARRPSGYSRDEQTQAVIACLKAGARIVEPEGITLILEPLNILVDHPRQLVVHSSDAADVLRAVGSPNVKMLFDIYHQQISEGNLSGNIRKYRDLIGYFQLADHPGPARAHHRRDQLPLRAADHPRHRLSRPDRHGDEPAVRPDGGLRGHPTGRRRSPLLEADGLTDWREPRPMRWPYRRSSSGLLDPRVPRRSSRRLAAGQGASRGR